MIQKLVTAMSDAEMAETLRHIAGRLQHEWNRTIPSNVTRDTLAMALHGVALVLTPTARDLKHELSDEEKKWCRDHAARFSTNGKIDAIKSVRNRLNLGLKEAKDLVDAWYVQQGL
jgi:ribosomal protein L7/L12